MRTTTILRPSFRQNDGTPNLNDYIVVPTIALHGSWQIKDMLPPAKLAKLARFANELEGRRG